MLSNRLQLRAGLLESPRRVASRREPLTKRTPVPSHRENILRDPIKETRRIVVLAIEPVRAIDLFAMVEVFSEANRVHGRRAYDVHVVSAGSGRNMMSNIGLTLQADATYQEYPGSADTVLLAGWEGETEPQLDPAFLSFLKRLTARSRRIASVCTGTFVLARAGLLNGRRVTTHWKWSEQLSTRYPAVKVQHDTIFVRDGSCYTSAGATAGIDLGLALIEEDLGHSVAARVAQMLLVFLRRSGEQPQLSATLSAQSSQNQPLADLLAWLPDNLREDLSVKGLADRAAMSPRNFARLFRKEIHTTPAKHIENVRLEAAQHLLQSTALNVEGVADAVGLSNCETLRRLFTRRIRQTPGQYRASSIKKSSEPIIESAITHNGHSAMPSLHR